MDLFEAARTGDLDRLAALIAAGADPDAPGPCQMTPLMVAVMNRHTAVLKVLIRAGATVNAVDEDEHTALVRDEDLDYLKPLHFEEAAREPAFRESMAALEGCTGVPGEPAPWLPGVVSYKLEISHGAEANSRRSAAAEQWAADYVALQRKTT